MQKLLHLPRYKQDWREICAILPVYLPDGANGTEITYLDSTRDYIPNRLGWVLDDLLGYRCSSKAILTRQSRQLLGKAARRVPLVLSPDFILVPVKGRRTIGAYHAVIGYVVMQYMEQLIADGEGCRVQFAGGVTIQVLERPSTLWENIRKAQDVSRRLGA